MSQENTNKKLSFHALPTNTGYRYHPHQCNTASEKELEEISAETFE